MAAAAEAALAGAQSQAAAAQAAENAAVVESARTAASAAAPKKATKQATKKATKKATKRSRGVLLGNRQGRIGNRGRRTSPGTSRPPHSPEALSEVEALAKLTQLKKQLGIDVNYDDDFNLVVYEYTSASDKHTQEKNNMVDFKITQTKEIIKQINDTQIDSPKKGDKLKFYYKWDFKNFKIVQVSINPFDSLDGTEKGVINETMKLYDYDDYNTVKIKIYKTNLLNIYNDWLNIPYLLIMTDNNMDGVENIVTNLSTPKKKKKKAPTTKKRAQKKGVQPTKKTLGERET